MITFTDKKLRYGVEETKESIKMNGTLSVNSERQIEDLNGSFYDLEGNYLASFSYREYQEDKCDKSINNVSIDNFMALDTALDNLIVDIKDQLPE